MEMLYMTRKRRAYSRTMRAGLIRRTFVWLSRMGRCKGFGIQSPWAYNLVCNVINVHDTRTDYKRLSLQFGYLSHIERRLHELYLRLADRIQPNFAADTSLNGEPFRAYINAGHRNTRFTAIKELRKDGREKECAIIRLVPCEDLFRQIENISQVAKDGWTVIVEDIHGHTATRQTWRKIVRELPQTVTFDLYYCGLIFFDGRRYKQNYIINF